MPTMELRGPRRRFLSFILGQYSLILVNLRMYELPGVVYVHGKPGKMQ